MLRQYVLALLISVSMMVVAVHAGPFGFEMGMSFEKVRSLGEIVITRADSVGDAKSIELTNPPKKHSHFVKFLLSFKSGYGLYQIRAWSDRMNVGNGGEKIMKEYQVLRTQLHEMYKIGGVRKEQFFTSNSWESPEEWTKRFLYLDRAFITKWRDISGLGGTRSSPKSSVKR